MITNPTPPDPPIVLAFDLLRRYAERQGWIPIGFRTFTVGSWTVTVNGTSEDRGDIPKYHALVQHRDILAFLLMSPFGGSWGGWQDAEAMFIQDLEAALAAEPFVRS